MKAIFCDIDGVLNSKTSALLQVDEGGGLLMKPHQIHVCILNAIVKVTDALVVITSTWRKTTTREIIWHQLNQAGYNGDRIAFTPELVGKTRGAEIKEFLANRPEIISFVIIDDDSDMDDLSGHLIQTKTEEGLLANHILPIIKMLDTQKGAI